jgi:hypothetical protein
MASRRPVSHPPQHRQADPTAQQVGPKDLAVPCLVVQRQLARTAVSPKHITHLAFEYAVASKVKDTAVRTDRQDIPQRGILQVHLLDPRLPGECPLQDGLLAA